MAITRVGGVQDEKGDGRRSKAENTAKVYQRRQHERAMQDQHPDVPAHHADHLIPQRDLRAELEGEELHYLGTLLAGVQDFKILRGSIAVLNLATSTEFAHLLADVSVISRGNVLVCDLYEIPRSELFDDEDLDGDLDGE